MEAGPYEEVARDLAGTRFASIRYVEETASTNIDAAALLDDQRYGGYTIVAEYQRQGAGRKGRMWVAPAGSALLFTTILPRAIETESLWVVPYWVALVVRNALLEFGIATTLQWPNDVLLHGDKLAGILCQSSVSGGIARIACGVGINVRRPGVDPDIHPPPAYCSDVATIERATLLRAILRTYDRELALLEDPQRVKPQWDEAAGLPGRRYRIQLDGQSERFEATAMGLVAGGGLAVRRDDGSQSVIALADARILRHG
jgi:BirA family transcriptional regulator, biotin operon repressor / biotin---[acetyl-CoA-carboxylase] ligase